jgi:hypothetical protein
MPNARTDEPYLTDGELSLLIEMIRGDGDLRADIVVGGEFSRTGFIRFAMLERLLLRGYLADAGHNIDERNMSYHYTAFIDAVDSA